MNFYLHFDSIVIGLTIEPENKDQSAESLGETAGPSSRLRAVQLVQGYMLKDPDPNNPDRLSVWFTGGKLFPVAPPEPDKNSPIESQNSHYGGFDEWKRIFGEATSSSWSESFKNMGAKLFLGAELSSGMGADGSMAYTLHRPYGGHGKSFVEVGSNSVAVLVCQAHLLNVALSPPILDSIH